MSVDTDWFVTTVLLFSISSVVWIVDRAKSYLDEGFDGSNAYCIYLSVHIEGIDLLVKISDFTTEFLSEFRVSGNYPMRSLIDSDEMSEVFLK